MAKITRVLILLVFVNTPVSLYAKGKKKGVNFKGEIVCKLYKQTADKNNREDSIKLLSLKKIKDVSNKITKAIIEDISYPPPFSNYSVEVGFAKTKHTLLRKEDNLFGFSSRIINKNKKRKMSKVFRQNIKFIFDEQKSLPALFLTDFYEVNKKTSLSYVCSINSLR